MVKEGTYLQGQFNCTYHCKKSGKIFKLNLDHIRILLLQNTGNSPWMKRLFLDVYFLKKEASV